MPVRWCSDVCALLVFITTAIMPFSNVRSNAQERECTIEEAKLADSAIDRLTSWYEIHEWYTRYRQCDDGGPAEGVSERVARILVDRWETLPQLVQLTRRDLAFRRFVLKHVDETLNKTDLKRISANADTRSPNGLRALCHDLKQRAEAP